MRSEACVQRSDLVVISTGSGGSTFLQRDSPSPPPWRLPPGSFWNRAQSRTLAELPAPAIIQICNHVSTQKKTFQKRSPEKTGRGDICRSSRRHARGVIGAIGAATTSAGDTPSNWFCSCGHAVCLRHGSACELPRSIVARAAGSFPRTRITVMWSTMIPQRGRSKRRVSSRTMR
jgi:hypothetical protein